MVRLEKDLAFAATVPVLCFCRHMGAAREACPHALDHYFFHGCIRNTDPQLQVPLSIPILPLLGYADTYTQHAHKTAAHRAKAWCGSRQYLLVSSLIEHL